MPRPLVQPSAHSFTWCLRKEITCLDTSTAWTYPAMRWSPSRKPWSHATISLPWSFLLSSVRHRVNIKVYRRSICELFWFLLHFPDEILMLRFRGAGRGVRAASGSGFGIPGFKLQTQNPNAEPTQTNFLLKLNHKQTWSASIKSKPQTLKRKFPSSSNTKVCTPRRWTKTALIMFKTANPVLLYLRAYVSLLMPRPHSWCCCH